MSPIWYVLIIAQSIIIVKLVLDVGKLSAAHTLLQASHERMGKSLTESLNVLEGVNQRTGQMATVTGAFMAGTVNAIKELYEYAGHPLEDKLQ
jgi:hypothetical protein